MGESKEKGAGPAIRRTTLWLCSLIGAAIMTLATVPLREAESTLAGNFDYLGLRLPEIFQTALANWAVGLIGAVVLTLSGFLLWRSRRRSVDFDDVREWSLSVDIGCMASSHGAGNMTRYIRDMCRFVNLSTTQARVVDVIMTIPYLDKARTPVTLSATRRLPIDDVRIGPVLPERYDPFLSLPIRIEPSEVVEGRIEFEILEGGVPSDDLDLLRARATIRESRSHQARQVREGEVYDAHQQRAYRGRIGDPHPVWGPRFKRWKRRLSGKPIFTMGTVGQMAEDATRRMAEIERQEAETDNLIPFVALRDLAPQWGVDLPRYGAGQNNPYYLEGALQEAAARGNLRVEGRKYRGAVRHNDPLVPIPAAHFEDYGFGHGVLGYDVTDNEASHTGDLRMMTLSQRGKEGVTYYDLHLSARDARKVVREFAKGPKNERP